MANAVFTSSVTYEPGGGGTITQGFRMAFDYSALSAGRWDIAVGSTNVVVAAFGGVSSAQGLVLQNNTDVDIGLGFNSATVLYHLAPGGLIMHWAPKAPGGTPLQSVHITPTAGPTKAGYLDFIILGS